MCCPISELTSSSLSSKNNRYSTGAPNTDFILCKIPFTIIPVKFSFYLLNDNNSHADLRKCFFLLLPSQMCLPLSAVSGERIVSFPQQTFPLSTNLSSSYCWHCDPRVTASWLWQECFPLRRQKHSIWYPMAGCFHLTLLKVWFQMFLQFYLPVPYWFLIRFVCLQ